MDPTAGLNVATKINTTATDPIYSHFTKWTLIILQYRIHKHPTKHFSNPERNMGNDKKRPKSDTDS
jgi:hypothetical protein